MRRPQLPHSAITSGASAKPLRLNQQGVRKPLRMREQGVRKPLRSNEQLTRTNDLGARVVAKSEAFRFAKYCIFEELGWLQHDRQDVLVI